MLRSVDNYQVEVLLSLALVAGGYALADAPAPVRPDRHGGRGPADRQPRPRPTPCRRRPRQHLDTFWELIDEILNAVLFVLIGLEVLALTFTGQLPAGRAAGDPGGAAGPAGVGGAAGRAAAAPGGGSTRRTVARPDLGRAARRHLGGAGPVAAAARRGASRCRAATCSWR